MLRPLPDLPPRVIGFEAVGEVHADDYRDVLRPALDQAAVNGEIRFVYVLGDEFTGYSAGADWQDLRLAFQHVRSWERTAVVTDVGWIEHAMHTFGWMAPGELKVFPLAERDEAVRWAADLGPAFAGLVPQHDEVVPVDASGVADAGLDADVLAATEGAESPEEPAPLALEAETGPEPPTPVVVGSDTLLSGGPAWEPAPLVGETGAEPAAAADAPAPSGPEADAEPFGVGSTDAAPDEPVAPEPSGDPTRIMAATELAGAAPAAAEGQVPEQWAPDPTGRHQYRWWNGSQWTEHVADYGRNGVDPLG